MEVIGILHRDFPKKKPAFAEALEGVLQSVGERVMFCLWFDYQVIRMGKL